MNDTQRKKIDTLRRMRRFLVNNADALGEVNQSRARAAPPHQAAPHGRDRASRAASLHRTPRRA